MYSALVNVEMNRSFYTTFETNFIFEGMRPSLVVGEFHVRICLKLFSILGRSLNSL